MKSFSYASVGGSWLVIAIYEKRSLLHCYTNHAWSLWLGHWGWKKPLALEVIYDLQDPDCGTFFCDLTEATSELGVALTVARAMNIKLRNIDPIGQLGELFAKHRTLLVLDNLEQVIGPVGNVITRWMEQSDSLRIIATSPLNCV